MSKVYRAVKTFKKKYPMCIAWRLPKHAAIIEKNLHPGEKVLFAFPGQREQSSLNIFSTCIVCLTDKRILVGKKGLIYGWMCISITPDKFNDLKVRANIIFGKAVIDTLKEEVMITNLDKKSLATIKSKITTEMLEKKKKFFSKASGAREE